MRNKHGFDDQQNEPQREASRPPQILPVLEAIAARYISRAHRWDRCVPRTADGIARFWVAHQEPPTRADTPHLTPSASQSGKSSWRAPYIERLALTLAQFLTLPATDQQYVIAAAEDKIYWRGDSMEFFVKVIGEYQKMGGDPSYREKSIAAAKKFLRQSAFSGVKTHD